MDSTVVLTMVGGLLVMSTIILTSLCLYCRGSSQPKQITQHYDDEMNRSSGLIIIRPNTGNSCPNTLSPVEQPIPNFSSHDTRRPSPCPSPDGSHSDYVNEEDSYEQPPDSDKNNDYLIVLPDDTRVSQPSLASSANSGQNYQNVGPEENSDSDDSDSQQYMNLKDDKEIIGQTPVGSFGSCSSDGQDSSDYVNAPNQVSIHLC